MNPNKIKNTHFMRRFIFNSFEAEMRNVYNYRDYYFTHVSDYLKGTPEQQAALTEDELVAIKDEIREALHYFHIVDAMAVPKKDQCWYTELLVELFANRITGRPPYQKPVVTIKLYSKKDYAKFWDTFVDFRQDVNAPDSENYCLKIGGITAIDWDILLCHKWNDDFYHKRVDAEPDMPTMSFDIDNNTICERYPNGPKVDFDQLEKDLQSIGIKRYKLIKHT